MEALRFPSRFIHLIMDCVQTVKYSILVQGTPDLMGKLLRLVG